MNDGINNSGTDTDNRTVFPEDEGMVETVSDISEDNDSGASDTDSLSDSMGSDTIPVTDTESDAEYIEDNSVGNTEIDMETENSTAESSTYEQIDYTSDLNHIDSLLYDVRTELQDVQSVSGNSITVTLDSDSMQVLTAVQEKQDIIIDGQATFLGLVGCLVFAVCADFLVHSAKRIMKNITGKRD